MDTQGRLAKVMLALVGAMTLGALILVALEGQPLKPLPFSLASQIELPAVDLAAGTETGISPGKWRRIEVFWRHAGDACTSKGHLDQEFLRAYHFIIDDGSLAVDGRIHVSNLWKQQLACASGPQTGSGETIRICLMVSQNERGKLASTGKQKQQLDALVSMLVRFCQIEPRVAWRP